MKLLFLGFLILWNFSWADEGGNSFWYCGQFASLIAVPKNIGWKIDSKIYYYNQKSSDFNLIVNDGPAKENISSQSAFLFLEPSYTPDSKWFGGQPSFTLAEAVAYDFTKATITYDSSGASQNLSQNIWGISNMYPYGEITWNKENHNYLVYVMGGIPFGNYNPNNLANFGTGHYALDLGFGYTYWNKESGWEGSGLFGLTYNFVNPQTDYQNGIDSHLDYAISKFLSKEWELGMVGYVYYQLTGDKGNLGSFKSKAAALGAEGTYFFNDMNFTLRGYYDLWTQNRLGGFSMYAVFTVEFPN